MADEAILIDVAKDFSSTPGGRYKSESLYSGEEFRLTKLAPALANNKSIVVDLDGPVGFTSGFMEEAFGGLVRQFGPDVVNRIKFKAEKSGREIRAISYMLRALENYEKR